MSARRLHRLAGLVMMLPLVAWALTGLVFFLKPGYAQAYAALPVRALPLKGAGTLPALTPGSVPGSGIEEARTLRTVLGPHLLVRRTDGDWEQLDPVTLRPRPAPSTEETRRLIEDAITADTERYGRIVSVDGAEAFTSTGVRITLDWNTMSLAQRGRDTDLIDRLYRIHYLQWTGIGVVDRATGLLGIGLILVLSGLGAKLLLRP